MLAGGAADSRATAPPPVLDLRAAAAGELRIGDSETRVRRLWGRPLSTATTGQRQTLTYGYSGGTMRVYLAGARIRMVTLGGALRTTKGDRIATPLSTFRRRWGGAVHNSCCAVGVRHVRVPTTTRGISFAGTFRDGRLQSLTLLTESTFRSCFLAECD